MTRRCYNADDKTLQCTKPAVLIVRAAGYFGPDGIAACKAHAGYLMNEDGREYLVTVEADELTS